ncbi:MAG: ABC transporter substrate-binding protein [Planctomycetota bacterium]
MIRARSRIPRGVAVALLGLALFTACGERVPPPEGDGTRIVSLVPSATETLFALGAGDLVVGRSAFCDWPPEVERIPAVGDAISVRAEKVLALRPGLVLVGSDAQEEALRPLGDRVRVLDVAPKSIADVLATIRLLAKETGREARGEELVREIEDALGAARRRRADGTSPRVLFVAEREPLVVAGGKSYVGELIEAIGARNVTAEVDREWPGLSLETLVALDPEVLLESRLAGGEADSLDHWQRFHTLSAVRTGHVLAVREPAVVRPGPRLPAALACLERLVWEGGR